MIPPLDLSTSSSPPPYRRPNQLVSHRSESNTQVSPRKVEVQSTSPSDTIANTHYRCPSCNASSMTSSVGAVTSPRKGCRLRSTVCCEPSARTRRVGRLHRVGQRPHHKAINAVTPVQETLLSGSEQLETFHTAPRFPRTIPDDVATAETDTLPLDPRQWNQEQVHSWIQKLALKYKMSTSGDVIAERFPMNGKGLCVMAIKPDMLVHRVPSGGLILFHELRSRLIRSLAAKNATSLPASFSAPQFEVKVAA